VPNLVSTFGYINASWTLRADLVAEYFCRLVNHMEAVGARQCTPTPNAAVEASADRPYIMDFSSGYIQRVLEQMPKQGIDGPWTNPQDYKRDKVMFRKGEIDDGALVFSDETQRCA
jgi:monooxygenase